MWENNIGCGLCCVADEFGDDGAQHWDHGFLHQHVDYKKVRGGEEDEEEDRIRDHGKCGY